MSGLITPQAFSAFQQGRYHQARNAYRLAAERLGPEIFEVNFHLCNERERAHFIGATSRSGDSDPPITYCVPILNRLSDLKRTLADNLKVLSQFRNVKLIVNLFDKAPQAYQWATEGFREALETGLLEVHRKNTLDQWHMSTVKNSFKAHLDSGYYSSLDGDNYLTTEEVVRTKQAIIEFGPCLVHHFSGNWEDGTCGRVTLPVELYKSVGYTEELYPRQFDELSLIVNVLYKQPDMLMITRHGVNILQKTLFPKDWAALNGESIQNIQCDLGETPHKGRSLPLNAPAEPLNMCSPLEQCAQEGL